jgi:signal peptidase I
MARKNKKRQEVPPAKAADTPPSGAAGKKRSSLRENFASLVATAVLALFFTTFVAQAFEIPSESMEDTLLVGDRPFVNKVSFAPASRWVGPLAPYREIRRGDIIIFKHPGQPDRIHMVKRAVGLPGDHIRILHRQVIINGRLLDEGYKMHKMGTVEEYRDNFPAAPTAQVYPAWSKELPSHVENGELIVPPGHYFAMGDNRDYSLDSRYWGLVPREAILGRPLLLYWSMDFTRADYQASGPGSRLLGIVQFIVSLPTKTRWSRLFRTFPPVNP